MINIETLQQAHDYAKYAAETMNALLDSTTAVESLALNRLTRQASELRAEIGALLTAAKVDAAEEDR